MHSTMNKDEKYETILTGINGLEWPTTTFLEASIMDKDGEVFFNKPYVSSGQHAEMKMLSDEKFQLAKTKTGGVSIVMTVNYSPCSVCAPKLIGFYKINKTIQNLTIRFAHLYTDTNGLKDLHEEGITLEAMDDDSWNKLGIDFKALDKDPDWEEKIKEKSWLWMKRSNVNIELVDVKLKPDWKEKIRAKITKRDKQTRVGLEKLLPTDSDVEELDEKVSNLTLKERSRK